jgi:hypothetical protein
MKLSGFGWVRNRNGLLGLCLYLVLLALVVVGAANSILPNDVYSAASSTTAKPPVIQVFKAEPMVLATADAAAVYTFKVKHATDISLSEAGNNIKNISNPSGATINGTATGLPAGSIPTDASGKFVALLLASNEGGTVQAELTLSLGADLLPEEQTGSSDNRTGQRTPKWGPLTRARITSTPSNVINEEPKFFKCTSDCDHCLKPEEAVSTGYGQRCSDELCYYSPDKQQRWYCYKPTPGWCCANQQVSQTTKSQCTSIGGYWSVNQYEAQQACQPQGFCCLNYQVYYPVTQDQCRQRGGSYWSTNQAEVTAQCQRPCYCCLRGQVYQTSEAQCKQSGGICYDNQSQAYELCQPTCWCCANGQVFETTQARCRAAQGGCYASQSEAAAACRYTAPSFR